MLLLSNAIFFLDEVIVLLSFLLLKCLIMSQTYKPSYKLNLCTQFSERSLLIIWNSDQTSQFLCGFFPISSCVLSHFLWLLSLRIWSSPITFHWWHLEYFLTYWLKCLSGFGFWTLAWLCTGLKRKCYTANFLWRYYLLRSGEFGQEFGSFWWVFCCCCCCSAFSCNSPDLAFEVSPVRMYKLV